MATQRLGGELTLLKSPLLEITSVRILSIFALDMEFAPWRRKRSFVEVPGERIPTYDSNWGQAHVRVVLTGVGSVRAGNAARSALRWQPDICVSAGLAGSLRSEYRRSDVVAAESIVELESGRTIVADSDLLKQAKACGAAGIQRLVTSSIMIASREGKTRLGNMGDAVEMESFAVASEAVAKGISTIGVRAISDEVDEDLPMDFSRVLDEDGGIKRSGIVRAMARAPHKLPALMRLGRHSRAAAGRLAEFMERYVCALAGAAGQPVESVSAERA